MTDEAAPPPPTPDPTPPSLSVSQLSLEEPTTTTTPKSKDPTPFKFGTRLLTDPSTVFTHNAWDHVSPDASYRASAAASLTFQRSRPATPFDTHRFNAHPSKWWDAFYKNNAANFFKDRNWLAQEFPLLSELTSPAAGEAIVVEVGCGAGNTLFPILRMNRNPRLCVHGCDFSRRAVDLVKGDETYLEAVDKGTVVASVYDISEDGALPEGVREGSVDVVVMVFVFSALSPAQWAPAVGNVRRMLKPGGRVLFRDYGRGDLAQVRFKAGRYLEENFYVRGDGTRVYFFDEGELRRIFAGEVSGQGEGGEPEERTFPGGEFGGFKINDLGADRRMLVNRKTQVKMYRCWMQAVFEKL